MPSSRLRSSLIAVLFSTAAACGIDSQDKSGTPSGPPDISGSWTGVFVSSSDSRAHAITSLTVVKQNGTSYRLQFDVASNDPNGVYDPEGFFLDSLLNAEPLESKVDDSNQVFVSARGGDLVLNAYVSKGGSKMDGDWLQVSPIDEQGTWSVSRVSSDP